MARSWLQGVQIKVLSCGTWQAVNLSVNRSKDTAILFGMLPSAQMAKPSLREVMIPVSFYGISIQRHGLKKPVSASVAILRVPSGYSIFQTKTIAKPAISGH